MVKKMNLASDVSLKELAIDKGQFNIPKRVKVDFSMVRSRNVYEDGKATDKLESYILTALDERTVTAIEQGLLDEDVAGKVGITVDVHGSFDEIEQAIESGLSLFVELQDIEVRLLWVDGRNPGYKKVKLVAGGLRLVDGAKNQ